MAPCNWEFVGYLSTKDQDARKARTTTARTHRDGRSGRERSGAEGGRGVCPFGAASRPLLAVCGEDARPGLGPSAKADPAALLVNARGALGPERLQKEHTPLPPVAQRAPNPNA